MTFRPDPQIQTIEVPAEFAPRAEGSEPLRVDVRTNMTLAELHHVDQAKPMDLASVFVVYAPFVIGWTLDAPPPAEAGPEQFRQLPHLAARWVVVEVIQLLRAEAARVIAVSNAHADSKAKLATTSPPTAA